MQSPAIDRIFKEMNAFMAPSVLFAMAELDLGTHLMRLGNAASASDLAKAAGCDARACEALLDTLAALGYFTKSGTGAAAAYGVAEEFRPYLDSAAPETCIPIIRHLACQMRLWARLAWTVRDGLPQERVPSILGAEQDRVSFIMGMNSVGLQMLRSVMAGMESAGLLSPNKSGFRILDVGGASGTYTEAFLRRIPESSATLFDLPVGVAQARKRFEGSDLESRVTLEEGDFTKQALPSGFDFAWVSAIIHQFGRAESRKLYRNVFQALEPGGMIAVRDFVMDSVRTSPLAGSFFGINMLVATQNGMVYTLDEIREDLEAEGFCDVTLAVPAPTMGAVVTARRPE